MGLEPSVCGKNQASDQWGHWGKDFRPTAHVGLQIQRENFSVKHANSQMLFDVKSFLKEPHFRFTSSINC